MASDAVRGSKIVIMTFVVAIVITYFYWMESNRSTEFMAVVQRQKVAIQASNSTMQLIRAELETYKHQVTALEAQRTELEEQKKKSEDEKKKLEDEKKKLAEEKKGFEAKIKESAATIETLKNEKAAQEKKLQDMQAECVNSCNLRVNKTIESLRQTTGRTKSFFWQ